MRTAVAERVGGTAWHAAGATKGGPVWKVVLSLNVFTPESINCPAIPIQSSINQTERESG